MSLKEYQEKRAFDKTPEPAGGEEQGAGPLRFVVQKHRASRLHYDVRLEFGGTLKSWACPKGPSLNPGEKRLAVMVEDHPLDYRTFEGVIPEGNYGAGTVMVWDEGDFIPPHPGTREENERTLAAALEKGHLSFLLKGKKLKGEFALVRLRRGGENDWLLIKANDDGASDQDVLEKDRSAITDRTMEEIAEQSVEAGDVWGAPSALLKDVHLKEIPEGRMPENIQPMLATAVEEPFDRSGWIFEVKWDGYRAIAEVQRGGVRLYSRHEQPLNGQFPPVVESLAKLGVEAVLDGEVVVVDETGVSRFEMLQTYRQLKQGSLIYYVFDILWLDGHDLRGLPLVRRKEILSKILPDLPNVRYSGHIENEGCSFFHAAASKGLEGIMAKDGKSVYRDGVRSRDWAKIKTRMTRQAVIGGFTEPRGGRQHLGALILGAYKGDELVYIGHTGGGSDDKMLKKLHDKLEPLQQDQSPFKGRFKPNAPVHWVEPKLVCEVLYAEMTKEGLLRQPIFSRLREDVPPRDVRLEAPGPDRDVRSLEAPDTDVQENQSPDMDVRGHQGSQRSMLPDGKSEGSLVMNGKPLWLTNLSKVYWPDEGYTKGDLIAYYRDVAEFIVPHLKDRPESLNRFPNGIRGKSFYHKDVKDAPKWAETIEVRSDSEDKDISYILCQDEAALVYLANLGCIEMNPWLSRKSALENPDYLVLDLDPEDISFEEVIRAALEVREVLDEAGAPSFPKTSGASGIHIYVPLESVYDYDQAKTFAEVVAKLAHQRLPKTTSVERMPVKRQQRVYLDFLQNRRGQTLAAPYSVRPQPGATVSTPLAWEEVKPGLHPGQFTMRTIGKRLEKMGDIFSPVLGPGIDLATSLERLSEKARKLAA